MSNQKINAAEAEDGKLASAAHHVTDAASAATKAVGDAADAAREKAGDAATIIRDRAADAYDTAREKASTARHSAASSIETNPLATLAGGIALGAVLGALLPKSDRESQLLGPIATRASDAARQAFVAAKGAGKDKLDELGINRDAAREKVDQLVDSAAQAASSAGAAAKDAVKARPDA